jgi:hypothetical protein
MTATELLEIDRLLLEHRRRSFETILSAHFKRWCDEVGLLNPPVHRWTWGNQMLQEKRIAEDPGLSNHAEAADFFNRLLLDLKKQLLGYPHDPVTMERLNQGTAHVLDLDRCRRPMKLY